MISKYFVLSLLLLCSIVRADPLDKFIETVYEQEKASQWVENTTKGKVPLKEAIGIVSDAYAYSISKNINPRVVLAVMWVESGFRSNAKSGYGAKGIMQVVPRYHKDKLAGRNPFLNEVSTDVGTTVLRDCLNKFKQNLYKGLYCYSGGSKTYYSKVVNQQLMLSQSLIPSGELVAISN